MNKHVEKAMEIRNETPMVNNCAQTILRAYADELGITGDMAAKLSANFGGGMKCGFCNEMWFDMRCDHRRTYGTWRSGR